MEQAGSVLTMPKTLEKLDRVKVFNIVRILPDGTKDTCPSSSGEIRFFTDGADATAAVDELKRSEPDAKLRLELVPLGRAFALVQGLMGLKAPSPARLHFARSTVAAEGEAGVPENLRDRMRAAGPFPLFYAEHIGSPRVTPVFFSRDDLLAQWVKGGNVPEALPPVTVTDLRIVVARTLQEPGNWKPLVLIPPSNSAELVKALSGRAGTEAAIGEGFVRGARTLAKVEHAVALADGDVPPPLTAGGEGLKI
jgi:hypothetical protein